MCAKLPLKQLRKSLSNSEAGHCSFASNDSSGSDGEPVTFNDVFTQTDSDVYDAIFYLEKPRH